MLRAIFFGINAAAFSLAAAAQNYPSKPIQLIVPYSTGGAADLFARVFGDQLSRTLKEPVVIQNKSGGNANIAHAIVARSKPDGYTLLLSSTATSVNPYLEDKLSWKPEELTPVSRLTQSPSAFVVPASSGQKNLEDFVKFARKTQHLPTTASALGNAQAVARIFFADAAGIRFTGVGYKGGSTFVPDLVAGTLVFASTPINIVLPLIESGKLTPVAVTGTQRSQLLPNVPTVSELGYPAATSASWFGIHAPIGTPKDILEKIDQAAKLASQDPEVKAKVISAGGEMAYLGIGEFTKFIHAEMNKSEKYAKLVKSMQVEGQLP